jgi:hypothetical protein
MNLRIQLEDGKHVHMTIESQDLTREIDYLFTFGVRDGNRWYPPSRITYVDIVEVPAYEQHQDYV